MDLEDVAERHRAWRFASVIVVGVALFVAAIPLALYALLILRLTGLED